MWYDAWILIRLDVAATEFWYKGSKNEAKRRILLEYEGQRGAFSSKKGENGG